MGKKRIAVVGATGLVGSTFLKVLEEYNLPDCEYVLMASAKSAGKKLAFMEKEYIVEELTEHSFDSGFDAALFSAGSGVSRTFAPIAASKGCVVVDNSAAWRMDPSVPLVVPEVNPEDIFQNHGIIANPNCSTIQAVVPLWTLHRAYEIKRIVYSTFQAVAGAGVKGCADLREGMRAYLDGTQHTPQKFPCPIVNNCIPQIDIPVEDGYYKEEQKMIDETRKIMHAPQLKITATCVRVPVMCGHSECINVEFEKPCAPDEARKLLESTDGVRVVDDYKNNVFPLAADCVGHDEILVGRIRRDFSADNALNLFVVADNLRKGAASNAVQIAKILLFGEEVKQ